jgi:tRNA dimethylallyltransferase
MTPRHKLIVLIGPTASGKTGTAIELARRFDGEVISADSRYFYKGMDIGTAKPTQKEMAGIPHHMIDVTDLNQVWSLALFKREAFKCIDEITNAGKVPILAGGTGQYIRAITEGWEIPLQEPDYVLRDLITTWGHEIGPKALHEGLSILDAKAAENIDYRNMRRTVRAIEVIFKTGYRFSAQYKKSETPFDITMIGINYPRTLLYEKIDDRIDVMIEKGFIEEVKLLMDQGYEDALRVISAIGYIEIIDYLQGKCTLSEAIMLIKRKTRIYVRRQANWFKLTDPAICWFSPSETMINEMIAYLQECGYELRN